MARVDFPRGNSRRADTEKPDEWRIDLDPMPLCPFDRVQRVAGVAHEVLDELGITGYPKTSGGRGLHVYIRIEPRWGFTDVRRAALAFAREVERRAPDDFTIGTVPARFAARGDLHAGIDDVAFSLEPLLAWADRDEKAGLSGPADADE